MLTHIDYRLAGVNSLYHGGLALEELRFGRAAEDFGHAQRMFAHAVFNLDDPQSEHVRSYYIAMERGSRAAQSAAIRLRDA